MHIPPLDVVASRLLRRAVRPGPPGGSRRRRRPAPVTHTARFRGVPAAAVAAILLTVPAAAQEPRPHSGPAAGAVPPAADSGSRWIEIQDRPDRQELVVTLGPVDLPARTAHHELGQLPVQRGRIPFDFTVNGYRIEVVDEHGGPVPQVVLHHFNLLDPGDRELFLPIMRRVLAASHETKPQQVPGWLFGLPFEEGDEFLALTMLHNPTERTYEGVRIRLVMEYERYESLPLYRIYPFHIDVMFPTGSKAFDLPPGRTVKSYQARPVIPGGIIGLGGHLHRYATSLTLEDVTEGRTLYRIEPVYGADGHVEEVPVQRYAGNGIGKLIHPTHLYRVTVEYHNPTPDTIPGGGMGSVAGGFIPLAAWPAADPQDPLYREDFRWVLESVRMHHGPSDHEHGTASAGGHPGASARCGNDSSTAGEEPAARAARPADERGERP